MNKPTIDFNNEEIFDNLKYLLSNNQNELVLNILADLHSADIAELIERMELEYREKIFALLNHEIASEVLADLEESIREDVLETMDNTRIAALVTEMDSDDAADIVSELSSDRASEVLATVEDEYSEEIQELMHYPEDSAGGIMAKEYVAVNANDTVEEAINILREKRDKVEEIYLCYVIDDFGKLVGVVPLKELILARPDSLIKEIMEEDVLAIRSDIDQEEVAYMFEKYDMVSAPVVNSRHQLIGRITIDDVVDVIHEEAEEDLARIAGIGEEEILEDSVFRIVQARLPWLIISFIGQIFSALIMYKFEASIAQILASTFFIPLVMAMGGSIGQQTGIIVVRGLATGEINPRDIRRRLWRETKAALINAAAIALLTFVTVFIMQGHLNFSIVLACTLITVVMNAALFGAIIPFGFKKFNIDPAIASGPFLTTLNDVIGLLIYFSMLYAALSNGLIG